MLALPVISIVALGTVLVIVVVSDVSRYIIPNWAVIGIAGLFVASASLTPVHVHWAAHVGAASLILVIGYAATHLGVFGGGDAKLWAAVALWTGFDSLASHSLLTALFGGILAIGLVVARRGIQMMIAGAGADSLARKIPRVLKPGAPVPYGLAISAAALVVFLRSPPAFLIGN